MIELQVSDGDTISNKESILISSLLVLFQTSLKFASPIWELILHHSCICLRFLFLIRNECYFDQNTNEILRGVQHFINQCSLCAALRIGTRNIANISQASIGLTDVTKSFPSLPMIVISGGPLHRLKPSAFCCFCSSREINLSSNEIPPKAAASRKGPACPAIA